MKKIISASSGKIPFTFSGEIWSARNIRYARADRFSLPQPAAHSEKLMVLPEKTPVGPQTVSSLLEKMIGPVDLDEFEVNETPLFLSVYLPDAVLPEEQLPIIVWIHGGSYELGCGDLSTADPTVFVKEQRMIMITVTYRIGIFGFLGGAENRSANLGLFDIIEALRWVRANSKHFGGNAENITLFGQSSGGDAVAHLMISEGVENLFHKVIIQSAPLGLRLNKQKMNAAMLQTVVDFPENVHYDELIDAYRKKTPSVYKFGLKALMPFGVQYGFPPLCVEEKTEQKWKEVARKYSVLIGINDEETAFYLRSATERRNIFKKKFLEKAIRSTTEKIYGKPAKKMAHLLADAGGNVFLYRIYSELPQAPFAAAHSIDLPLFFGNENAWKDAELLHCIPWKYIEENGRKIRTLWANFAQSGTPSGEMPEIFSLKKM